MLAVSDQIALAKPAVNVHRGDGEVVLEIADDGVGIEAGRREAALGDGHIGLASAVYRVEKAGGSVEKLVNVHVAAIKHHATNAEEKKAEKAGKAPAAKAAQGKPADKKKQ